MNYLQHRLALKNGEKVKPARNEKSGWYKQRLSEAPKCCENCGDSLLATLSFIPTAVCAHILSKAKVKSVAFYPKNIFYACGSCHDFYDRANEEEIKAMKIYPILRQRVAEFFHLIPANELRNCPECLRPEK